MTYDDRRAEFVIDRCAKCGNLYYIDPAKILPPFVCRNCRKS